MLPPSPAASTADPLPVVTPPACDCPQRVEALMQTFALAVFAAGLEPRGVLGTFVCVKCGRTWPHTGTGRKLARLLRNAGGGIDVDGK